MANKIPTVMTYPLTGAVDFAITFEYLARKFVTVTLIGKNRRELVLNQDYRFTTKTQITTSRAWTAADGYQMIEIRRFTSATERLVDFADGSILRAYDLNIAQIQTLHVAEEARDLTADNIGVNNDGHLDARGRRIVNLGEAVDPNDAVTLGQNQKWAGSALNSMNAAKVSEGKAKASENNAKVSENKAKESETRSITSETNSKNSETMSKKWAVNPLDEIVANNLFSAFHYANQANLSAGSAKTSENNSAASASASAASAVDSKNEADRAKTEADKLGNWNDLAGTIKSVDPETFSVTWKGDGSFDGNLQAAKSIRADERFYTESIYGSGVFAAQLNNKAAYSHSLPGNQDVNKYYPMIKQYGKRSDGWPTAFSMGMVARGKSGFHDAFIQLKGDGGYEHALTITIDGVLASNKGWSIAPDGNLYIKKYGSYIDAWVDKRLGEHAYNKSEVNNLVNDRLNQNQADGRYVRKDAGWTEIWSGSARKGDSVSLTKDVRWRTIWIKTKERWNQVEIGDNGAYFIQSYGGWLTFTISNNGRTFTNDEDVNSIPTAIRIRND